MEICTRFQHCIMLKSHLSKFWRALQVLAQHKAVWADEKQDLKKRIEQLDSKLHETKQALEKATTDHCKVMNVCDNLNIPFYR